MAKVLVVDDDPNIRELVALFLLREGCDIIEAKDGEDALSRLDEVRPDLAIIDVMMPRKDGWALCAELREAYDLPIIMLTAKGETAHKVRGFEQGADDYVVKPFDPPELVMRVKALLKRYRIATSRQLEFGRVSMDRSELCALSRGVEVPMPPKEFDLLFKLGSYPGKTFTREHLIEQLWGMDYEGDERTVDVHIKRLRERFPEETSGFRIVTIRGLGYRLEERL
ncbi:response regulator transcription factor [Paenibacillus sp. NPDC058071]|uniref:response regulator transcription factor n=1 Tax=Paenibacillus sp. NPDC058071 TaxID=3346326 RepID=UPI0036D7B281